MTEATQTPSSITTQSAPPAIGLLEFTLEVADLAAAEQFYVDHLGLRLVERWGDDRPAVWLAIAWLGTWIRLSVADVAVGRYCW